MHPWIETICRGLVRSCAMALLGGASVAMAQPAGWSQAVPIIVTEHSGAALTGYQLRMVIDTTGMAPGAADLRFGADATGNTLLDYWIESGAGTASTVVWVRLPALPASGNLAIYMFSGNPSALSASTVNTFDFTSNMANSATNQVSGANLGGVTDSQRGFRFSPLQDVLLTDFGKNEPNGSIRYVTLFDFNTQAILAQAQVSGPAGSYSYQGLPQPVWLQAGTQYLLEIHQGSTDGYYFGAGPQINPLLQYLDMRYCNGCTQNTFPTNVLPGIHYGYVDFLFRTRQQVTPEPGYMVNAFFVTGSVNPVGAGTVSCDSPVLYNESSSCTASPNSGYVFTGFSGDCTGMSCSLATIQSNKIITANFRTVVAAPQAIPVLGAWGLALLGLLAAGMGSQVLRRRR